MIKRKRHRALVRDQKSFKFARRVLRRGFRFSGVYSLKWTRRTTRVKLLSKLIYGKLIFGKVHVGCDMSHENKNDN